MGNLVRRLSRRHLAFLISTAVLFGAFEFLICAAVASANIGGALQTLLSSLPPIAQSVIRSQLFGGLTVSGLLAFGWNHPIAHAVGAALGIVLASRAIAGEVEAGTIELVLGSPLSRLRYFGANVTFGLGALALLTLFGLAGTVLGQRTYGLERFAGPVLLRLAANYFVLQGTWFGIALLLSAYGREGSRVASLGFLIALVSYLAQAIGTLWSRAAFVLPYTIHHYYSPQEILVRGGGIGHALAVLLTVLAVSLAGAWRRFRARDLP